jgi:hypothetical protein
VSKLILTHTDFQRLDSLAKTKGGTPIFCVDSMPGGPVRFMDVPIPVCVSPCQDVSTVRHIPCITLVPIIDDVDKLCNSASECPELDRGQLPKELAFDYLVHHEIGHVRGGDCRIIRHFDKVEKWPPERMDALRNSLDMRADRYAWGEIFPGVKMPVRSDNSERIATFDAFLQRNHDKLERHRPIIKPLPTMHHTFIPVWNLTLPLAWSQDLEQERVQGQWNPLRRIWEWVIGTRT